MKTRKQNKKSLLFTVVLLVLIGFANITNAEISVEISPTEPTINDPIDILVSGAEVTGGVIIDSSELTISGNSLNLDIYLNVGNYDVVTPWSHEEPVGTLTEGFYDLTVNTYKNSVFKDTNSMDFQVTPEPSSIIFLAIGMLGIFKIKRKR